MAPSYQENRLVKVVSPFGADVLLFSRMSGVERLSEPFQYDLTLLSERGDLNPDEILGKPLTVAMKLPGGEDQKRYFHGLVTHFSWHGYGLRFHEYRAVIRPWYWFLTRTADCRVFQKKNVQEIFREVTHSAGFSDVSIELRRPGDILPREYCVQYRETDFNFLSRLLEEEGIFYFFRHSDGRHDMVLTDEAGSLLPFPGYEKVPYFPETSTPNQRTRDHVSAWTFEKSFHPGQYATRDYSFELPSMVFAGTSTIQRKHGAQKFEIFDYPTDTQKFDSAVMDRIAKVRVQELQVPQMIARGSGNAAGLMTGRTFELADHPRRDLNIRYLIVSTSIQLSVTYHENTDLQDGSEFAVSVEAADLREAFRPARVTPKPVVQGAQTAVVVGAKGEEIFTDRYARVKVQFHWDRYGKQDEHSSCWVRVATSWAGKNWGAIRIPRVGQEVIVAFLEGDPDKPLVIGSLYNAANMPPYELPANRTQSGVKSRSSLDGTPDDYNEIRFEDKKGSEHLLIHAQKDQIIEVENDESHSVGHDRKKSVKNDESTSIGKNRKESVGENEEIQIGKDRTETVGGNERVTISKDQTVSIAGNRNLTVSKDESVTITGNRKETVNKNEDVTIVQDRKHSVSGKDSLTVGKQLLIKAADQMTLQSGSASITLKKDGTITIKGNNITLEGSGKINVKASGDVIVKGASVKQN